MLIGILYIHNYSPLCHPLPFSKYSTFTLTVKNNDFIVPKWISVIIEHKVQQYYEK
jgi:hypothetical protein